MQMFMCLMLSQRSLNLSLFLCILFSIFCSAAVISTILSGHLSILLPQLFCYCFLRVYCSSLFFSSSGSLVNISCIFSILFLRSWIIFTIIILNSFSGRFPGSTLLVFLGGSFIWFLHLEHNHSPFRFV